MADLDDDIVNFILDIESSLLNQDGSRVEYECSTRPGNMSFTGEKLICDNTWNVLPQQQTLDSSLYDPAFKNLSETETGILNYDTFSAVGSQEQMQDGLAFDFQQLIEETVGHDDFPSVSTAPTPQSASVASLQQQIGICSAEEGQSERKVKKKPMKVMKYQRTVPFADKKQERQRISAIKSKLYRERKKRLERVLKKEAELLKNELKEKAQRNNTLIKEIEDLRRENDQLKKMLQ